MKNKVKIFTIFIFLATSLFAINDFPIVQYPTWVVSPEDTIWIYWADPMKNLNNNTIYFSRNPGGANVENYTDSIKNVIINNRVLDGENEGKTLMTFRLSDNPNFKPGINYAVLADKKTGNTVSSNEIKIILKHSAQNTNLRPSGEVVDNATPQFSWTKPSGVPYSHVILSDEEIEINLDGTVSLESIRGTSMIWQTITPNNRVTYGEPDQSGIFTTTPPPLSPGKKYTWLVFNNYGNNPAYTPTSDFVLPAYFEIKGQQRPEPKNIFPLSKDSVTINTPDNISFKWTNLDPNASVYRVFVYTSTQMGDIDAQIVVWSEEITAGQFKKSDGTMVDTASLTMNAKDILSENLYSWRVIAVYNDGSGQAGELDHFRYRAPAGKLIVRTQEEIEAKTSSGKDTLFTQWLSTAEIKMEVLDGSLEESILFYTDNNGYAERYRSAGTVKLTAEKTGYESENQIITISEGETVTALLTLRKPISSIYGKITDVQGNSIDLANITAISDNGDTVTTQSLPDGNYVMNCKPESWTLFVKKQGFLNSTGKRIVLTNKMVSEQNIVIEKNNLLLSGTVRNSDGQTVAGAVVKILSADGNTEISSLLSTPSNGRFSFSLLKGTYIINVTKAGLVSVSDTIQFSTSQDRQIVLTSGAALLKGTLMGKSWISKNGTLELMSAAVTNAKVEVINETTNNVIATTTTDKTYGAYSISVPTQNPAINYRLRFTADGFETMSALTNSVIVSGNTYSQDFTVNAFATISGNVFEDDKQTAVSGISVSLVEKNSKQAVSTSTTNTNGEYTLFRISDGEYLIFANGSGWAKGSVELITNGEAASIVKDTVKALGGRFFSGETAISSINITVKPANSNIIWTAITNEANAQNDTTIAITVYSPLVQKLENGTLSGIDPSISYFVRAVSSVNSNIIDCVEKETNFEDINEETLKDKILIPFVYVPTNDNTTTIKLQKWKSINIDDYSISLNYRQRGETNFNKSVTVFNKISDSLISFDIPYKYGTNIEFYFDISLKSGSVKYSNKTHPYTKFIAADPAIITRWELLPSMNNVTVPLNGGIKIFIKAYYGANFTELESLTTNDFTWKLKTNNASKSLDDDYATIRGNKSGKDTLVVSINPNSKFQTAQGVPDSIVLPITITDSEISSINIIMLSDLEHPEFITNKDEIIFAVEATDKKGNTVTVTPEWKINPAKSENGKLTSLPGTINEHGVFTPNQNFIGRAHIIAQINSRIRDEFVFNDNKGVLVAYTANSEGGTVYDYDIKGNNKAAEITVAPKAARTPIIISLDKLDIENFVERDIEETNAFIISDIFEIKRQIGEDFRLTTDSTPVSLKLFIPQIYHKNLTGGQSDKNKLDIAVWDRDSLRWEYSSRATTSSTPTNLEPKLEARHISYDATEKSLSLSIIGDYINNYDNIRVAIIAKGLNAETEISISPNPFSPFVSPMNDYRYISGMNGDVKGTCIKITPKTNPTKFKPSAQIGIFTADGTPVYRAKLNGLNAGQSYYLFWDGRTQLSQTAFNSVDIVPDKAIFVKGNEMCRNGRYFINVTIDDGKEKKRYTKEIILFK